MSVYLNNLKSRGKSGYGFIHPRASHPGGCDSRGYYWSESRLSDGLYDHRGNVMGSRNNMSLASADLRCSLSSLLRLAIQRNCKIIFIQTLEYQFSVQFISMKKTVINEITISLSCWVENEVEALHLSLLLLQTSR